MATGGPPTYAQAAEIDQRFATMQGILNQQFTATEQRLQTATREALAALETAQAERMTRIEKVIEGLAASVKDTAREVVAEAATAMQEAPAHAGEAAAAAHSAQAEAQQAAAAAAHAAQSARVAEATLAAATATAAGSAASPALAPMVGTASKGKHPYTKLSFGKEKGRSLSFPLDSWIYLTEQAFALNAVPEEEKVAIVLTSALDGDLQVSISDLVRGGSVKSWTQLGDHLKRAYGERDTEQKACLQLHKLTMRSIKGAKGETLTQGQRLEAFVRMSRELHLKAGSSLTEDEKYRCFIEGLDPHMNEQLQLHISAMEASGVASIESTFDKLSAMALKVWANPTVDTGSTAMELAAFQAVRDPTNDWQRAARAAGWSPSFQQKPKPQFYKQGKQYYNNDRKGQNGSGSNMRKSWNNGDKNQGWKPQLSNAERRSLMAEGKCLCCKEKPKDGHRWKNCPRNPDNRENA